MNRKVRDQGKGGVTFIVLLFVLTFAAKALYTFEANARLFPPPRGG